MLCDVCYSRWRDEDRDEHMVGIAQRLQTCGPGEGVEFVSVTNERVVIHLCNYCLKAIVELAKEKAAT